MIQEALVDIKNKYFSSAMQKKEPNMRIESVLALSASHDPGLRRQDSALSARSGYSAQDFKK